MAFSDMLHAPQLLQILSAAWKQRAFPQLIKYFDLAVSPYAKTDCDPVGSWPVISDIFYSTEHFDGQPAFRVKLDVELRDKWLAPIQRKQCVIIDFRIGYDACRVQLLQKNGVEYTYDITFTELKDTMVESCKGVIACIDGLREHHRVQMNGKRLTFWYKSHSQIWNLIQAQRRIRPDVHVLLGAKNKNPLNAEFNPYALNAHQVRDVILDAVDVLGKDVAHATIETVTEDVLDAGKIPFHKFLKLLEEV